MGRLDLASDWVRSSAIGLQIVAVVYVAAGMVMDKELSLGMLFAFMLYRANFTERAEALAQRAVEFRLLSLHLERLSDIVHAPRDESALAERLDLAQQHIELDARHSYPLQPGVTLSADVLLERRRLVEYLLAPLLGSWPGR